MVGINVAPSHIWQRWRTAGPLLAPNTWEVFVKQFRGQSIFTMKWGVKVADRGFSMVPNFLIWINKFAPEGEKLTPTEFFVLLSILSTWWTPDEWPAVSKRIISERTRLSERQVQRTIASLEKKGYLLRTHIMRDTGGANAFNMSGTVYKVNAAISEYYEQRDLFTRNADFDRAPNYEEDNVYYDEDEEIPY